MKLLSQTFGSQRVGEYRDSAEGFLSKRWVMIFLTVFPAVFLFLFITVIPILWAFAAGFFEISLFSQEWTWIGLGNYEAILNDDTFWAAMEKGIFFTAVSILIELVIGIGLALLINRTFRFQSFAQTVVLIPYLIPTAVVGYFGLWMNNSTWGITNQILHQLGLISEFIPFYGLPEYAMWAVIGTFNWKYTIFVTLLAMARLYSIPDDFYESATVCGATAVDKFRDITVPRLKSVIFIVVLLRGVWTFNKFDIIWILTRGGPGDATTTAPVYAFETAFTSSRLGRAAAVSVLLFLILLGVAIIYFKVLEPEKEVRVE